MPPELADRAQEVIEALGPVIIFTQQEERYFIDAREVPACLEEMQTRLREGLKGYLGHPEFAERYIRNKLAEHQKRQH